MSKHILIITGSPRKKGNTSMLVEAFAKGAQIVGHTVTVFDAAAAQILPCKACDACWKQGAPCIFQDDFNAVLAPKLDAADVVVFASPLYWFTFSAQLKLAIDKIYSYLSAECDALGHKLKARECVLLTCAAELPSTSFDGIIATYHQIERFMEWTDRGVLAVPGVFETRELTGSPYLDKATELGKSL